MHDSPSDEALELVRIAKLTSSQQAQKQPKKLFLIDGRLSVGAWPGTLSDDEKKRDDYIRAEFLAMHELRKLKRAA